MTEIKRENRETGEAIVKTFEKVNNEINAAKIFVEENWSISLIIYKLFIMIPA